MSSSRIEVLNDKNFSECVSARKELTIVQFYDDENASCHIINPVFNRLREFYANRIVCYRVLKPEAYEIWEQFKISQTPTFLLMKENKTVEKISGLTSYNHFISLVERFI